MKRLPKIGASMELREFADGVRVLQSLSHSNEQVDSAHGAKRLCVCRTHLELRLAAGCQRGRSFPELICSCLHCCPAQVVVRIATLVRGEGLGPALSVNSTAAALQVPLTIAREHLLTAEACGMLCRDDGPEGLRFFRNFFAEVQDGGA